MFELSEKDVKATLKNLQQSIILSFSKNAKLSAKIQKLKITKYRYKTNKCNKFFLQTFWGQFNSKVE